MCYNIVGFKAINIIFALIAQLDRALDYGSKG